MMVEIDHKIFLFLNSLHASFLDPVMWILSMKTVWIPLYLAIIWMVIRKHGKSAWIPLLIVPVLVLIDDQSTRIIKSLVERPRPCNEPLLEGMVHIFKGHCAGGYSFISGHAANSFGIAAYTAILLGKRWFTWCIFVWAVLISYSRIYLGVHYPGDILSGALLGLAVGTGLAWIAGKLIKNNME